jgi:hypothetical protein
MRCFPRCVPSMCFCLDSNKSLCYQRKLIPNHVSKSPGEAAETVLGYFGFDRTAIGYSVEKRNRKWWYALSEERNRDIENEKL